MENSEIKKLSLPNYVDFIEEMAILNGCDAEKVNFDYCYWHGVISEARYFDAKRELERRDILAHYYGEY